MNLSGTVAFALTALLMSSSGFAQDRDRERFVPGVIRDVVLDPTTYAPAVLGWVAERLDWQSSQVFFQNGWVEHNSRFTLSGHGEDTAMAYGAGNRQIAMDALANLQVSLVNNATARVVERLLVPRYPTHSKAIRVIGWIERSVMASYLSYHFSVGHFNQWQDNTRQAKQFGL